MNHWHRPLLISALLFMPGFLSASANAATCDGLAALLLPNTTINSAQTVAAGTFVLPPGSPRSDPSFFSAFETLRAFCRVQGIVRPSTDSHIGFEVWLPMSGWNGRYMGAGNGGFGGMINYYRLAEAVNAGYAGSATDTGHRGTVTATGWAVKHPQKVIDFNYRAVHETADKSKGIIRAFYSANPTRSYFNSCSNGGRQGIVEALRYPADYDGILAGAPSFNLGRELGRREKTPQFDETIPNLKAFPERGGKLILYHGANDGPGETVKFFERVLSTMGQKNANEFVRLYIVPEMGHCGGGPVPEFGLRLQPHADSLHSMVAALEQWVENGVAPNAIIATKYRVDENPASGIVRTRPLCPYPMEARWTGKGSVDEAANYVCDVVPK
jgi:Tannase and feruloyl esterase